MLRAILSKRFDLVTKTAWKMSWGKFLMRGRHIGRLADAHWRYATAGMETPG